MHQETFLEAWASIGGGLPNAEQLAIMDHTHGPLQIIAGPGSGKTYALTLRILSLLCVSGYHPSQIVVTTFTRKAATELVHRLGDALSRLQAGYPELGSIDLGQLRIGTLHSLCYEILTQTPGSRYRHLHTLNALEQAFFLYTTNRFCKNVHESETGEFILALVSWIDGYTHRSLPGRWQRVKLFTRAYERLVNDRIDTSRFANASPVFRELVQLVEEYEEELQKRHFTDQTLLQRQALELLTSPEGHSWTSDIRHVIVDEYQDTNPLQAALYRALAANPPHNLCVVGDDDQALYRFRGGTVGSLVHFVRECQHAWPACEVHKLSLVENYRSEPPIIAWCNAYILAHPQMQLPHARVDGKSPLRARLGGPPDAPFIWAISGKNVKESAINFARSLSMLKEQGIIESYAQCALLAHSLKDKAVQHYINALHEQGIPTRGLPSYKEQKVYQLILGTLFLALDSSKNLLPTSISKENVNYIDACRQAAQDEPVLERMARKIGTWLRTHETAASNLTLTSLAQQILNAGPCIAAIEQIPEAEAAAHMLIATLDAYERVVSHGYHIPLEETPGIPGKKRCAAWWMQRLYSVLVEGIQQGHLERGEERLSRSQMDSLSLLTIHSAKGLEFPVVAVAVKKENHPAPKVEHALEREVFPFRQDWASQQEETSELLLGGDDDERAIQDLVRLHYVAYSRAQKVLLLLITDDHLKSTSPALGLGPDADVFRCQIEIWPVKKNKGAQQHGLWD